MQKLHLYNDRRGQPKECRKPKSLENLPEGRAPNNGRWLGSRYKWLQTLLFSRWHAETLLKFRDAWHAVSKGHHRGVEQFSQRSASQRGHWAVSSQTSLLFGAPLGTGDHQNFVHMKLGGNWIFAKFIHLLTLKIFVSLWRWGGITHVGPMLAWLTWLVTQRPSDKVYFFLKTHRFRTGPRRTVSNKHGDSPFWEDARPWTNHPYQPECCFLSLWTTAQLATDQCKKEKNDRTAWKARDVLLGKDAHVKLLSEYTDRTCAS